MAWMTRCLVVEYPVVLENKSKGLTNSLTDSYYALVVGSTRHTLSCIT